MARRIFLVLLGISALLLHPSHSFQIFRQPSRAALRTTHYSAPTIPSVSEPRSGRFPTTSSTALRGWPWEEDGSTSAEEALNLAKEREEALRASEVEAQRYHKRIASLESELEAKEAELTIMDNRVIILQDVAKRLRIGQNETIRAAEEWKSRAAERDHLERTLNATYDELARETARLNQLVLDERVGREVVRERYDDLVNELESKDQEMKNLAKRKEEDMSELERRLKVERRARAKDRNEFEKAQADLNSQFRSATEKARALQNELNNTVASMDRLRIEIGNDDRDLKTVAKEERKKRQFLKQELVAARMAEREAVESLERMEKQLAQQRKIRVVAASKSKNVTDIERVRDRSATETNVAIKEAEEKVEIATAAVRAAEQRELKAQEQVSSLQEELRSVLKHNDRVNIELRDARDQQNVAVERLKKSRSTDSHRQEALSRQVAQGEENLRRVGEEMDLLRTERDGLRDSLLDERLKFAGERREDQMRYDRIMGEERQAFETEIFMLKEQISRISSRLPELTHRFETMENLNNNIRKEAGQDFAPGSADGAAEMRESVSKKPGFLRRRWKRIRSWYGAKEDDTLKSSL